MTSSVYILRHASPEDGEMPNRTRPLSALGHRQAETLVPHLRDLHCVAVYSSPFTRALETIAPFCLSAGLRPIVREDLGERTAEEGLPEVRDRMVAAVREITAAHPEEAVLICTHGGAMAGLLTYCEPSFSRRDYEDIGTPDLRRLVFDRGQISVDHSFSLPLSHSNA